MMAIDMNDHTIVVARDYSETPLGRFRTQGRFSGQRFREDYLQSAIEKHGSVTVVLDGAKGLSTGFLDEAFAGLVRERVLSADVFWDRVKIVSDNDPFILDEIREFVAAAATQARVN